MTPDEFVHALDVAVHEAAATGTMEALRKPPGRRPDPDLVELSRWFHGLGPDDKAAVSRVADLASKQATYNFLLVLDGLLAIEPQGEKGRICLYYEKGESRTQLSGDNETMLTVLFREIE